MQENGQGGVILLWEGGGTLGRVWELLKQIHGVVGMKRKLGDADWSQESTDSSADSGPQRLMTESSSSDASADSVPPRLTSESSSSDSSEDVSLLRQQLRELDMGEIADVAREEEEML